MILPFIYYLKIKRKDNLGKINVVSEIGRSRSGRNSRTLSLKKLVYAARAFLNY